MLLNKHMNSLLEKLLSLLKSIPLNANASTKLALTPRLNMKRTFTHTPTLLPLVASPLRNMMPSNHVLRKTTNSLFRDKDLQISPRWSTTATSTAVNARTGLDMLLTISPMMTAHAVIAASTTNTLLTPRLISTEELSAELKRLSETSSARQFTDASQTLLETALRSEADRPKRFYYE